MGDIGRSHTTGVEDSHGELGTRFTDGLSGHDTDGLAKFDEVTGGHVKTIAVLADAILGLAGEERADLDFLDAALFDLLVRVLERCSRVLSEFRYIGKHLTRALISLVGVLFHRVCDDLLKSRRYTGIDLLRR